MKVSASDKSARVIVIGLIIIIVAFLLYAFFYLVEWIEEEVDMGPTREAKENPFLAAEMYLNRNNIETEVTRNFSLFDDLVLDGKQVSDQDTIIIVDGRGAVRDDRFAKLYQWVEQGGTLITSTANPFIGYSAGDDPILNALGLEVVEAANTEEQAGEAMIEGLEDLLRVINPSACDATPTLIQFEFDNKTDTLEVDFDSRNSILFYAQEPSAWATNADDVILTYHEVGNGYLYVTIDNQIWRNRRIHCFDHAFMLWHLVNPDGKVWFVINQNAPSLMAVIWAASPIAVTGLLLSLLLWLWKSGIRFGPVYHPSRIERRSFAEHIHAHAVFLWRHHQQQTLLDQLKKDIAYKLERRNRDFNTLPESDQLAQMEQLTGLDRTDIYRVYFQPLEKNRQHFIFACKTLKQIKDKL